jgi:adenosine kinase
MKIACTGSIAFDYLMSFPGYFKDHILPEQLDKVSLSFLVDTMVRHRGGVAANITYTLALFGIKPYLVATAGEDFGEYRAALEKVGVNTEAVKVIPGKFTASFFVNTDKSNAQIASFYTGAMANASDIVLGELRVKPDLLLISPNDPAAMVHYAQECRQLGISYLYDPSQQIVRMSGSDLRQGVEGAYALFVNEYEFELLRKHTGLTLDEMIGKLRFMVITHGEAGATVFADGSEFAIPVVKPKLIVDPTGVGDAFRAGFITGLDAGLGWEECGRMGALAATYCLEQSGPQSHYFTPVEFIKRYRQNFSDHGAMDVLLKK